MTTKTITQEAAAKLLICTWFRNNTGRIGSPSLAAGWSLEEAMKVVTKGTSFKLSPFLGQLKLEIVTSHGSNNFYIDGDYRGFASDCLL